MCNGKHVDTGRLYPFSDITNCKPIPNNGFDFSSWTREIGSNRTTTVTQNDHKDLLTLVSLLSPKKSNLIISKNDNYTANFIKTQEVKIPEGLWIALIGIIASLILAPIAKWFYGSRRRKSQKSK